MSRTAFVPGFAAALLLAAAAVAPLAPLGAQTGRTPEPAPKRTMYEDLQLFTQVFNQIRVNHPDSADTHRLIVAAIEGMLSAQDPHSYVSTAYRLSPEREKGMRSGKLLSVPIAFRYVAGAPVVVAIAPGTAAAREDILRGDELVAIDGAPVLAENAFDLDLALVGERNSTAALTFERRRGDGTLVQLTRTVKRERIGELSAVPVAMMLDPRTGYVRISSFENMKVADDLHDALGRLERQGMARLVLDLRDNPGGLAREAAAAAGEFLPQGTVVYTQEGRKRELNDTVRVERSFWSREKRYPMVVLINEGSASAAEMMAGALQDHDRALLVGRPTFGKSLVMLPFPLTDGSVVVLVVGHARTPCGRIIQRRYQGLRSRDYYRAAGTERDTTGRPSCRTSAGRTVYGGGGVVPDVRLPELARAPRWLARVHEEAVLLGWIGGHIEAQGAKYTTVDAFAANPTVPPAALADFRRFAAERGITIPSDAETDERLQRAIVLAVASTKWGDAGWYRIQAVIDPDVSAAVAAFDKADALLR